MYLKIIFKEARIHYLLVFLISVFVITANAALPKETEWLGHIDSNDQTASLLLLRNKGNSYVFKELMPKAKSADEQGQSALTLSLYILTLSEISTDSEIKTLLYRESQLLGDIYVLGISNKSSMSQYSLHSEIINSKFREYNQEELGKVLENYGRYFDNTFSRILKYVHSNVQDAQTKNESNEVPLSKTISNLYDGLIKQNDGAMRINKATYLVSTFHFDNKVVLNFQIFKNELIESTAKERGISKAEVTKSLNSEEFRDNLKSTYFKNLSNYYCSFEATKKFLDKDGVMVANFAFDDGTALIQPLQISKISCLSL